MRKYQSFKNFEGELEGLIMRVEAHWANLEFEIQFFAKVQEYVEDHIQLHFGKLVSSLSGKLQLIGLQIESIASGQKKLFRRTKFALLAKNSLATAISEFVEWHNLLQPLLFLLPRSTDPRIDRQINAEQAESHTAVSAVQNLKQAFKAMAAGKPNSVAFVPDDRFQFDRQLIQYTSVEIKRLPGGDSDVIIDSIPCEGPGAVNVIRDVRNLASILGEVEPMTFGIPACAGVVKVKGPTGKLSKLEMVFKVPQELENPRSLRNLLISLDLENGQHPINARIQLAKRLARTVLFVHSADFVHKNFRPETVIVFDHREKTNIHEIGIPFLIGFQKIRLAGGPTAYMGDTAWEQNIYRHPSRQGQFPEQAYNMQHDIYSLGVCLLEIALWKPFVRWDTNGQYPSMTPESERLLRDSRTAFEVKEKLIGMAREMIPNRLGNRYTEVTVSCLKCLDEDGGDNSALLNEDGISVGVSYIEKVSPLINVE